MQTIPLPHVQTEGYKSGGRGRRTLFSLAPSCPFALAPLFATDALRRPLLRAELLRRPSSFFFLRSCRCHRAPGWARTLPLRTSSSFGHRGACRGRRTSPFACRAASRGLGPRGRSAWSSSRTSSAGSGCRRAPSSARSWSSSGSSRIILAPAPSSSSPASSPSARGTWGSSLRSTSGRASSP